MIGPTDRQASLFSFAFFREVSALRDPVLEPIDALLEDASLLALSTQALAARSAHSVEVGRLGLAPDRLLRCVVLKHLKGWSFRELRRELRSNLVYRRFTRFYEDPIPDPSIFCRSFALLGEQATAQIHQRVVEQAKAVRVAVGQRLRTDTTAVEVNIHYPTDSSLLADGVRVLTRSLQRVAGGCQGEGLKVVDHTRATKRRVLEICRAARSLTQAGRTQFADSYRKLIRLTATVARQARRVVGQLGAGERLARPHASRQVGKEEAQLRYYLPLVEKVIAQSQARVLAGETRHPEKILSLFEPHSVVIRKGKADKPNEFGRLVRIDEVENGIVSHYQVALGNPADQQQWVPALQSHVAIFGAPPKLAAADRGFWSGANVRAATELGVKHVVLPARGRLSAQQAQRQKERWFRHGQGWRAGIEARVSTLKHCFGMERAFYKGEIGFQRHVGWCIIAHNLVALSRSPQRPAARRCRSG